MNHNNLQNIGTYTHAIIDKHIQNQNNAHFGQNLTKNGNPIFNSIKIAEIIDQSSGVNKEYVDSKINGLNWCKQVKEIIDLRDLIKFNQYDRYISMSDYDIWKKNNIYEYIGEKWIEYIPERSDAVFILEGNIFANDSVVFNGKEWVKFGSTMDHNNLQNCGIYKHTDIDSHLINDTDAHFGQNLTMNGTPEFLSLKTENINTKILDSDTCTLKNNLQIGDYKLPINNELTIAKNDKINISYYSANENSCITETFNSALGDIYEPKAIQKNNDIGKIVFSGYDGKSYYPSCFIKCSSTENFTVNNHGTRLEFYNSEKIFSIEDSGIINCYSNKNNSVNLNGGMNIAGNLNINKVLQTSRINFNDNNEFSFITNNSQDDLNKKIISICGGKSNNIRDGSVINISGNDSNLDGSIQIKSGNINGKIELFNGNEKCMSISDHQCYINNIKCLNKFKLPVLTEDPNKNELGDIYYNSDLDEIRIYTKMGFKSLAIN